jgi:hypothetical protein
MDTDGHGYGMALNRKEQRERRGTFTAETLRRRAKRSLEPRWEREVLEEWGD